MIIASICANHLSNVPTIFHAVSAGEGQNGLAPKERKNYRYVDLIAILLLPIKKKNEEAVLLLIT